jgi:hypothetical protein
MRPATTRIEHHSLAAYTWCASAYAVVRHRLVSDDRGEGVISAAIVVLIMAFLGAAMWVVFDRVFSDATNETETQVQQIGN